MKRFGLLLILFATNSCAAVYKCGNVYSEKPCGVDSTEIQLKNHASQPQFAEKKPFSSSKKIAKNSTTLVGKVIRVVDGDTITILTNAGKEKIRFAQIDAPETSHFGSASQPYGKEASVYLRQFVSKKMVRVEVETVDQYGRNVGTVFVNGTNVNREMVKNGFAWVYRQYAHDAELLNLEKSARARQIGLWSLDNPIYPPDFRKKNR
ncbi:MAG: thermonuclease family protein [Methylococcaceae bacterium]